MSDNLKQFVLFEFEVDKGVEIVPSTWISKDRTRCKFPNPIPKGFSSFQSDPHALPEKDWTTYGIIYVATYGNFILLANFTLRYIRLIYSTMINLIYRFIRQGHQKIEKVH